MTFPTGKKSSPDTLSRSCTQTCTAVKPGTTLVSHSTMHLMQQNKLDINIRPISKTRILIGNNVDLKYLRKDFTQSGGERHAHSVTHQEN